MTGFRNDRLTADKAALRSLYHQSATPLLERRARAAVAVLGLGRAGAATAQALAAAGIGTLLLEDDRPVRAADLGPGAFRIADIGLGRALALRRSIGQLDPSIQAHVLRFGASVLESFSLDLVIFADAVPLPAELAGRLLSGEQPHLPVCAGSEGGTVGPLVVPGRTACTECVAPSPDVVGAQPGADRQPEAREIPDDVEVSVALALAGAAARAALLLVDGVTKPACWSAVQRLHARDGSWSTRTLAPDPDCGCQLQIRVTSETCPAASDQLPACADSTSSTVEP